MCNLVARRVYRRGEMRHREGDNASPRRRVGRLNEAMRVLHRVAERLLHQQVLARLKHGDARRDVQRMRQRHDHGINLGVRQ